MIEQIFKDEREQKILREAMERLDLSAEATIRYFCRMGQLVDHQIQQGYISSHVLTAASAIMKRADEDKLDKLT